MPTAATVTKSVAALAAPGPAAVTQAASATLTVIDARTANISAFANDMSLTWAGANWTFGLQPAGGAVVPSLTGSGDLLVRGKPSAGAGPVVVDRLKIGNSATLPGKTTLKAGLSFGDGTTELGSALPAGIQTPVLRMTLNGRTTYLSDVDFLYFAGANAKTAPVEFVIGYGGAGNDYIRGSSLVDSEKLLGGAAVPDDAYGAILLGGAGSDTLIGSALADVLIGGSGFDVMSGEGGNDTFIAGSGDIIDGGAGSGDKAVFSGSLGSYRFAASGLAGWDATFLQVSNASRTEAAYVTGVEEVALGADTFRFRWGSDTSKRPAGARLLVVADADNQTLLGGAQSDLISTKTRNSTVKAGAGNDRILLESWGYDALSGSSTVFGGLGDDRIEIESNHNVVYGDNLEKKATGNDAFLLRRGAYDNRLYGNAGADTFFVYSEGRNAIDFGFTGKATSDGKADRIYLASENAAKTVSLAHVGSEDFVYVARASGGAAQMALSDVQRLFGTAVTDNRSYYWTTTADMDAQAGTFFPA